MNKQTFPVRDEVSAVENIMMGTWGRKVRRERQLLYRVPRNASLIRHLHTDLKGVSDQDVRHGSGNKEHKCPAVGSNLASSRNPQGARMK